MALTNIMKYYFSFVLPFANSLILNKERQNQYITWGRLILPFLNIRMTKVTLKHQQNMEIYNVLRVIRCDFRNQHHAEREK
jgi:hypothetical protein